MKCFLLDSLSAGDGNLLVVFLLSFKNCMCTLLSHFGLSELLPLSRVWCGFNTHDPSSKGRLHTAEIVWSGL